MELRAGCAEAGLWDLGLFLVFLSSSDVPVMQILDAGGLFLEQALVEPVSVVPDQRLQLCVLEDAVRGPQEPLVHVLVVHRAELLDDEAHREILVTVKDLG